MACKKCDKKVSWKVGNLNKKTSVLVTSFWGRVVMFIFLSIIFLIPFLLNFVCIGILWWAMFSQKKGNINENNKNTNNTK